MIIIKNIKNRENIDKHMKYIKYNKKHWKTQKYQKHKKIWKAPKVCLSKNIGRGKGVGETPVSLAALTENRTMATLALSYYC